MIVSRETAKKEWFQARPGVNRPFDLADLLLFRFANGPFQARPGLSRLSTGRERDWYLFFNEFQSLPGGSQVIQN